MKDNTQRKALNEWLQNGVILFTGAGISFSAPSEIPTSYKVNEVIRDAILKLSVISKEIYTKAQESISKRFSEIRMETFFEVFLRNGFNNILDCLLIFEKSKPNLDHYSIAQSCKLGYINAIFTLNFDYLQEQAMEMMGVPFKSFLREEDFELDLSSKNNSYIPIYHLHNGFSPGT